MKKNFRFSLGWMLAVFLPLMSQVKASTDIDSPILEDLASTEYVSFFKAFKDKDIIMLFQPDCSACKAQVKHLACLEGVKFLGTNGSKDKLIKEYRRFKVKYPSYAIAQDQLKSLSPKLKMVTPQYFQVNYDSSQNLTLKNVGFGVMACEKLKTQLIR